VLNSKALAMTPRSWRNVVIMARGADDVRQYRLRGEAG
jgi:hypothetical protein